MQVLTGLRGTSGASRDEKIETMSAGGHGDTYDLAAARAVEPQFTARIVLLHHVARKRIAALVVARVFKHNSGGRHGGVPSSRGILFLAQDRCKGLPDWILAPNLYQTDSRQWTCSKT